jgi:hypothetical protein
MLTRIVGSDSNNREIEAIAIERLPRGALSMDMQNHASERAKRTESR